MKHHDESIGLHDAMVAEGDDLFLFLTLECPKCGHMHRLPWRQLSGVIRCSECGCSFGLGAGGRIHSYKRIRVKCPRCQEIVTIVKRDSLRVFRCPSCLLEMPMPETKKKEQAEKESQQVASSVPHVSNRNKGAAGKIADRLSRNRRFIIGFIGLILVLVPLMWLMQSGLDKKLIEASRRLMIATIQGDTTTVNKWVNSAQGAEYRLWVRNEVKKALAETRLGGGTKIRVDYDRRNPPVTWVEVTLSGANGKDAVFFLAWRKEDDGSWQLDASQTASRSQQRSSLRGSVQSKRQLRM